VFDFLDGELTEGVDLMEALNKARIENRTAKIVCKHFIITFYKKGTCHIEFTNPELLHKFNIFGARNRGWLPPSYGKRRYAEMAPEERRVVDGFEGKESYEKVLQQKDYYIVEAGQLLVTQEAKGA